MIDGYSVWATELHKAPLDPADCLGVRSTVVLTSLNS